MEKKSPLAGVELNRRSLTANTHSQPEMKGFIFKSPFPVVELVLRPSPQYLSSSLNPGSPPRPSRQPFSIFQLIVLILLLQPLRSLTLSQPSAGRFIGGEAEMGALWAACKGKYLTYNSREWSIMVKIVAF